MLPGSSPLQLVEITVGRMESSCLTSTQLARSSTLPFATFLTAASAHFWVNVIPRALIVSKAFTAGFQVVRWAVHLICTLVPRKFRLANYEQDTLKVCSNSSSQFNVHTIHLPLQDLQARFVPPVSCSMLQFRRGCRTLALLSGLYPGPRQSLGRVCSFQ